MRDVLEKYTDAFVGINYVDPRDTIVAMLAAVNDDYLRIEPYNETDLRTLYFPMADVRQVIEAPEGGGFQIKVGTGRFDPKVAVPVLIELSRPMYAPKSGGGGWAFWVSAETSSDE
jgi:hypothetical protein